jgi:Flp pilus assembly protein TadG
LNAPTSTTSFARRPAAARRKRFGAQGLVEFAIIGPLFLLMLFGIIEMGRLMWTRHELVNATREGSRYAMVHGAKSGAEATSDQVRDYMLTKSAGLSTGLCSGCVTVSYAGTGQPGEQVTVTSTYTYVPMISYVLNRGSISLSSTSKVLVQH